MLLKDCPVGSVVRLVSICDNTDYMAYNTVFSRGTFVVYKYDGVNCIIDRDGYIRNDIFDDKDYQFEIVSQPNTPNNHTRQITIDGITYKLTPTAVPKNIEIDGVVYKMEPV